MSAAILFGACGCCKGLTYEYQSASAGVPYPLGWNAVDAQEGLPIRWGDFRLTVQPLMYLTASIKCSDAVTGASLGTVVWQYAKNGTHNDFSLPQNPTGNDIKCQTVLSDPYAYADAIAFALTVLDTIQLLNPAQTFPILGPDGATLFDNHFCYPSEATLYGYTRAVYQLSATFDGRGNLVFNIFAGDNLPPAGGPFAVNGVMFFGVISNGDWQGWFNTVWVMKSAVRTPGQYSVRRDHLFSGVPHQPLTDWWWPATMSAGYATYSEPIAMGPGELIFLPSDVPGTGLSMWDFGAAPGLSPAGKTADNTTPTADDTNTTADQQ